MEQTEKTSILARLKALQAQDPGSYWLGVGAAAMSLFGMVAAFAVIPDTGAPLASEKVVLEDVAFQPATEVLAADAPFFHEERVRRGDTLATLLARLGVDDEDAATVVRTSAATRDALRRLAPGQPISATTTRDGQLLNLTLPASTLDKQLVVSRNWGKIEVGEQPLHLTAQIETRAGVIQSSLFGATDEAGVPDEIADGLVEIFDQQIDFHRDLRRGDQFRVAYERLYYQGAPVKVGRILAVEFMNNGKKRSAVWFDTGDGKGDFFTDEGKSLKPGFLRSPLEFSRVTSGMGMRFHPLLRDWREHKGVDYAAPTGTKVRATADGEVVFAGQQGGYGNFIVLRHAGGIETAYGHLSAILVQRGQTVRLGDNIGLVGATGWATGPHLHYEFRVGNLRQDPLTVALPNSHPLIGRELVTFFERTNPLIARLRQAEPARIARAD